MGCARSSITRFTIVPVAKVTECDFFVSTAPGVNCEMSVGTVSATNDEPSRARATLAAGQMPGTVHRLGDVRDVPVPPQTDLVAEDPISGGPATPDGACGDDAPLVATQVRDRRLLDDEGRLRELDLERGVVRSRPAAARSWPSVPRRRDR